MNNSTLSYSQGRNLRKIAFRLVLAIHGIFLLLLLWQPSFYLRPPPKKQLVIKTITSPPAKIVQAARAPASKAVPQPAKPLPSNPSSVKKKSEEKREVVSASKNKKEPAVADKVLSKEKKSEAGTPKPRAQISDALFKELEESIAKIENKGSAPLSVSKAVAKSAPLMLQIDTSDTTQDASFTEQLVACLQEGLTLPDYGEVKIQLDLREDGSVDKIVVLSAQSKTNKRYLEEHLPLLRFPRPDGVSHNKRARFVLTFANKV